MRTREHQSCEPPHLEDHSFGDSWWKPPPIIWLEDPASYEFVREGMHLSARRVGRVKRPRRGRVIGYEERKRVEPAPGAYERRFWWVDKDAERFDSSKHPLDSDSIPPGALSFRWILRSLVSYRPGQEVTVESFLTNRGFGNRPGVVNGHFVTGTFLRRWLSRVGPGKGDIGSARWEADRSETFRMLHQSFGLSTPPHDWRYKSLDLRRWGVRPRASDGLHLYLEAAADGTVEDDWNPFIEAWFEDEPAPDPRDIPPRDIAAWFSCRRWSPLLRGGCLVSGCAQDPVASQWDAARETSVPACEVHVGDLYSLYPE